MADYSKHQQNIIRNFYDNRESIAHNLRWIQVLGMSGDQVTAKAVQSTRLGRHLDHDEF